MKTVIITRAPRTWRARAGCAAQRLLAAALVVAILTTVPAAMAGQDASLRGTVRNEGGAGLRNVRITILHLDSEEERGTVTDARGSYRTGGLEPGSYRLSVTVEGFEPFTHEMELAAGEDRVVAIVLVAAGPHYRAVFDSTPDRWRLPLPEWQRYPPNQPGTYPFVVGSPWDPYNQNTIKGDRPVIGQDVFFVLTGTSFTATEFRRLPIPTGASTARPDSDTFFGEPDQFEPQQNFIVSLELFKGDTAFRPKDWSIKITPVFNLNYVSTQENNAVNINPEEGKSRFRQDLALQEAFGEVKLFDVGSNYDATSARAGIQPFISDFRGFLYRDFNLGFRLFGSWGRNRNQWNLAYFNQLEKEANSGLNTFDRRDQQVFIANYYRQDTFTLGYTFSLLAGANLDDGDEFFFDANGFLVRPAPVGTVRPHKVRAYYVGFGGDGHWGRINVTHQFYQAFGTDEFNGIAGREVDINAQFAVLELSIDKDWYRPKITLIYASGDGDPNDETGRGFDAILPAPFIVGGPFSFWNRLPIRLTQTGVELVGRNSILPSLRSNQIHGQANFVNPGLWLANLGFDAELTQKLKLSINLNYLRFDKTEVLEQLLFQSGIGNEIGFDGSLGLTWRPWLNDNGNILVGASVFVPGSGFKSIYSDDILISPFAILTFTY